MSHLSRKAKPLRNTVPRLRAIFKEKMCRTFSWVSAFRIWRIPLINMVKEGLSLRHLETQFMEQSFHWSYLKFTYV